MFRAATSNLINKVNVSGKKKTPNLASLVALTFTMLRDVKSWLVIVPFAFTSIRLYFKPDFDEERRRQAFQSDLL